MTAYPMRGVAEEPLILHFPPFSSYFLARLSPDTLLHTPIYVLPSMLETMCHDHTQQVKVKICETLI